MHNGLLQSTGRNYDIILRVGGKLGKDCTHMDLGGRGALVRLMLCTGTFQIYKITFY